MSRFPPEVVSSIVRARAKLVIDSVVQQRKPIVVKLVPVDEILAILSIEDPFNERPEESYKLIEDWVIDHIPDIHQKIDQIVDPVSNNLRNQRVEQSLLEEMILKTAANVLVDYIIRESGKSASIYDRYSDSAIVYHVYEEVEKAMRRMGLPVIKDSKPKLFSELGSHEKLK